MRRFTRSFVVAAAAVVALAVSAGGAVSTAQARPNVAKWTDVTFTNGLRTEGCVTKPVKLRGGVYRGRTSTYRSDWGEIKINRPGERISLPAGRFTMEACLISYHREFIVRNRRFKNTLLVRTRVHRPGFAEDFSGIYFTNSESSNSENGQFRYGASLTWIGDAQA